MKMSCTSIGQGRLALARKRQRFQYLFEEDDIYTKLCKKDFKLCKKNLQKRFQLNNALTHFTIRLKNIVNNTKIRLKK